LEESTENSGLDPEKIYDVRRQFHSNNIMTITATCYGTLYLVHGLWFHTWVATTDVAY
jgi:hypothetical protein